MNMNYGGGGWVLGGYRWGGLLLRTTVTLATTLPVQKPTQWRGGGSPGTQGMKNPCWPPRPTFSVCRRPCYLALTDGPHFITASPDAA